jgi:putative hemolysin
VASRQILDDRIAYPVSAGDLPGTPLVHGKYRVRFARTLDDLDTVLKLRFEVFNLELGEGLDSSFETGRDQDAFDATCHHLMVDDLAERRVIGTYRTQTAEMAARYRGFYSSGEFDFDAVPREIIERSVEVGRACVARPYRNRHVLFLLWKGLAAYLSHNRKRYLFGCCSLTSQDPTVGRSALEQLTASGHLHPGLRVSPRPGLECESQDGAPATGEVEIPILFRTYLRYGAKVCGPPAIDREFKTIDFLVILDTEALDPELRRLYF